MASPPLPTVPSPPVFDPLLPCPSSFPVQVLIDVLTDRGFSVSHTSEVSHVPTTFDLQTGAIRCRRDVRHRFHIGWDTRNVRDMAKAFEMATRMAEVSVKNVRISQSFIPTTYPTRESTTGYNPYTHSSGGDAGGDDGGGAAVGHGVPAAMRSPPPTHNGIPMPRRTTTAKGLVEPGKPPAELGCHSEFDDVIYGS